MRLISHSLTPELILSGILSLIGVGSLSTPRPFSALPPVNIFEASPKAISGRTSYIRVRLEFLRYPHVIRQLFNGGRFGPPLSFTSTSTCTWIGHLLFGQPGAEVPGWGFATLSSGKHPLGDACSLGNQTPDSSSLQITTLLRVQL